MSSASPRPARRLYGPLERNGGSTAAVSRMEGRFRKELPQVSQLTALRRLGKKRGCPVLQAELSWTTPPLPLWPRL